MYLLSATHTNKKEGLMSNKERKEHKHCIEIQKIQNRRLNGENLPTNELQLTLDVSVVLKTAPGKLRASH